MQVPFVGRFTSNRGALINLPLAGNAPCASLTIMSGPGGDMVPAEKTPPARTMTAPAAPFGCVAGNGVVTTTGIGAGVGAGFVVGPYAFARPLPGNPVAVGYMDAPFLQLATSFAITGPRPARTRPPAGSMNNGMNTAAFHAFKAGAWRTQTGRAGSAFTWCRENPHCNSISQGLGQGGFVIIKYRGGGNAFGGTMALIVSGGPNSSSFGIRASFPNYVPGGAIGFFALAPMGSQPTGRGYAEAVVDVVPAGGPLWHKHKLASVTRPLVGKQRLVTMVTGFLGNQFPKHEEYRTGFPWTTRTVLARTTATRLGNPQISTLTARGGDVLTEMGGRHLSLVAGGIVASLTGPIRVQEPVIAQFSLPEPRSAHQLAAGALALVVIAGIRLRARR